MNIEYDPRMKRMKISHIMRKYDLTYDEAVTLRDGGPHEEEIKETLKIKPIKETPVKGASKKPINTSHKESSRDE